MLLLALTVFSTLGTRPPVTIPRCQTAATTIAFDECLGRERDKAMRTLERYRIAARTQGCSREPRERPPARRLRRGADRVARV